MKVKDTTTDRVLMYKRANNHLYLILFITAEVKFVFHFSTQYNNLANTVYMSITVDSLSSNVC